MCNDPNCKRFPEAAPETTYRTLDPETHHPGCALDTDHRGPCLTRCVPEEVVVTPHPSAEPRAGLCNAGDDNCRDGVTSCDLPKGHTGDHYCNRLPCSWPVTPSAEPQLWGPIPYTPTDESRSFVKEAPEIVRKMNERLGVTPSAGERCPGMVDSDRPCVLRPGHAGKHRPFLFVPTPTDGERYYGAPQNPAPEAERTAFVFPTPSAGEECPRCREKGGRHSVQCEAMTATLNQRIAEDRKVGVSAGEKAALFQHLTNLENQRSAGETKPLTRCAAGRDGECHHPQCPQLRDDEPLRSGRHCPLDAAVGETKRPLRDGPESREGWRSGNSSEPPEPVVGARPEEGRVCRHGLVVCFECNFGAPTQRLCTACACPKDVAEEDFIRRLACYISVREEQYPDSLVAAANTLLRFPQQDSE